MLRRMMMAGTTAAPVGSHKFWRIYILETSTADNYFATVAEFELRTMVGGGSVAAGGTPSASSSYSTAPAENAFDGGSSTIWATANDIGAPAWLAYELLAPAEIVQIAITSGDTSARATRAPRDFDIQWSDDGLSWTTAQEIAGETGWSASETRTFLV